VTKQPYNHYSLLRSIEDNFGLLHLGYAGQAGLQPFGPDVLNKPGCPVGRRKKCRKRHHKKKHHAASTAKKHKKKKCRRKKRRKPRSAI
jgi:hypothetical protein